jgi:hypothetical protein
MTTLRRAVPVLAAMTVAMTLSSCVLRALGRTEAIDAVGVLFAAGVYFALLATRRWHGARERVVALPSVFVVGISFPVLLRGAYYLAGALAKVLDSRSTLVPMYASMMITSAIGAGLVSTGMYWATGRRDRQLRLAMVAWGACWPLLHLPLGIAPLDQASLLAWHLPVGLACAAWVVRCPPLRDQPAT